jgi:hypothetical protein
MGTTRARLYMHATALWRFSKSFFSDCYCVVGIRGLEQAGGHTSLAPSLNFRFETSGRGQALSGRKFVLVRDEFWGGIAALFMMRVCRVMRNVLYC